MSDVPAIYRVSIAIEGESQLFIGDAIEHQGTFLIVAGWIEPQDEEFRVPARLIHIRGLAHQDMRDWPSNRPADFAVNEPIPKDVLAGRVSPQLRGKYVVLERPDIRFPKKPTVH